MKKAIVGIGFIVVSAGSLLSAEVTAAGKRLNGSRVPMVGSVESTPSDNVGEAARVVSYSEREVVPLRTKLRYTTLIVLPKDEEILDFLCGDKEYWVINGSQNLAYVKPTKRSAKTNLNLVTASGRVYSFDLSEISDEPRSQADFKIFIELRAVGAPAFGIGVAETRSNTPKFVSVQKLEESQRQLAAAQDETRKAKESAQTTIDRAKSAFVSNMRFPYQFEAGKRPFNVRAMFTDGTFTYIQARPEEAPVLYEVKDGKANLIRFTYDRGLYVADRLLERGYLVIGKKKLLFKSED